MCSFTIITVSLIITRFELRAESVMLWATTITPRRSCRSLPLQAEAGRDWRRGWPVLAPKLKMTLPFQPACGASAFQVLLGSCNTAMS